METGATLEFQTDPAKAVQDLTRAGNLIRNNTFDAFNPLMVVALTYLIIVVALTWLLGRLEKRLHKGDRH